jgi:hypothetical protein
MTDISNEALMFLTKSTAQILKSKQQELQLVKWTESEANTDIMFSKLACQCCKEAWVSTQARYPMYSTITIEAEAPDINIVFRKDGSVISQRKIELKSGTSEVIPGSTIGNLDINEPVIFCLRPKSTAKEPTQYNIRYGQYHACMGQTDKDLFQDRTPRPHVNFSKMTDIDTDIVYINKMKEDWVQHYAVCALNRIKEASHSKSWQDWLVRNIITHFLKTHTIEELVAMKQSAS